MGATASAGTRIWKVGKGTLQELFAFNDWAWDKLMNCAAGLADAKLDQPFEMGEGSIRKTMNHLYAAERVWLDRWTGREPRYRMSAEGVTMAGLWGEFREHAQQRNAYLAGLPDAELDKPLTYVNLRGQTHTYPKGAMMLHVSNHGSHHRAQAVNMLRRVGAATPKPGADYVFMKVESPEGTPCRLDAETVRSYFMYADWARHRVHAAAANLSDEQLDRPFEMGMGTLRKTLGHIADAEAWWFRNWTEGPGALFPPAAEKEPLASIARRGDEIAMKRDGLLQEMTDEGLRRMVSATPRREVVRTFPIGVTMLQLCHHGTHHRAQAVNMLRHVGGQVPALDVLEMLKEAATG